MFLIGSRALAIVKPEALLRQPKDFDFICSMDQFNDWCEKNLKKLQDPRVYQAMDGKKMCVESVNTNCEFEIATDDRSCQRLIELVEQDPFTLKTPMGLVPSFNVLFVLKKSHRFLKNSPHFWKTLGDYHLMKRFGAEVPKKYFDFLKAREKETYSYTHPKLNQTKVEFFNGDQVKYVYDHDSIHEAVKLFERPAYTFFQKDGEQVAVDRRKFELMPRKYQLASVVEEASVLAIERSLVPYPGALTEQQAWRLAFSKVLTSITSGWWREFAYENAFDVLKLQPTHLLKQFQDAVKSGIVKMQ